MHYNWHRHYDPSLGRYTQPDPLGFVDGPSVYAYAGGNSVVYVDKDGRFVWLLPLLGGAIGGYALDYAVDLALAKCECGDSNSSTAETAAHIFAGALQADGAFPTIGKDGPSLGAARDARVTRRTSLLGWLTRGLRNKPLPRSIPVPDFLRRLPNRVTKTVGGLITRGGPPVVTAAVLLWDGYKLVECLSRKPRP